MVKICAGRGTIGKRKHPRNDKAPEFRGLGQTIAE
jgi:hypothetical protein